MNASAACQSNVTPLFRKPNTMNNQVLIDLLTYWEHLRAGRIVPLRSEIDPRQIEDALEHTFILEKVRDSDVRFRLAGMSLCELMGMEVRGMPPAAMIIKQDRSRFETIVDQILDEPEIVELQLRAKPPKGTELAADMLLLPLRSNRGQVSRILGAIVCETPFGPAPQRFGIASCKVTRIISTQSNHAPNQVAGFAEGARAFTPAPSKPVLRLVKS